MRKERPSGFFKNKPKPNKNGIKKDKKRDPELICILSKHISKINRSIT
jgi:hypothetical protein